MSRTLIFAQQKGGAGKTTLLTQLAGYWAEAKKRVVLMDLDPQRSLTGWAEIRLDQLGDEAGIELVQSSDWRAGSDIRKFASEDAYVLVDCPGNADVLLRAVMREADLVVSPCQPSIMDAWALAATQEMANDEKAELRVVMNRLPPRGGAIEAVRAALKKSGVKLMKSTIGNRVGFATSFLNGRSAFEASKRAKAAVEVKALGAEIDRLLKKLG